jgi:soluble lytic murein transglycosylase-like protein
MPRAAQRSRSARRRTRAVVALCGAAVVAAAAVGAEAPTAAAYRVQPGDTLTAIAAAHGLSVTKLAHANRLDPADVLLAGIVLRIPLPKHQASPALVSYTVQPGDTLSAIAFDHGMTVDGIARLNHLDPQGILFAGSRLQVPPTSKAAIRASIAHWAAHYGVPLRLALALAWQESGHQQTVVSSAGAHGVMQVMPTTWKYVEEQLIGQRVPHTADGNVRIGIAYLRHLLRAFDNRKLAIAAYAQGEASVRKHGIFRETRGYVADVLALAGRHGGGAS